jgi:hypothetical protein
LQVLRNFGMGRNVMEAKVRYCTDRLLEEMYEELIQQRGKAVVDLNWPLTFTVANVINGLMFGYGNQARLLSGPVGP